MITRRQFFRWLATFGAAGVLTGAYGMFETFWRPKITRYDVRPARWPAGFELTMAVLADIHACHPWMPPERIRTIVETTNALGTDLVLLLGDYMAGHRYVTDYVPAS